MREAATGNARSPTAELALWSVQTLTTISVFALNWCRLHVEVHHTEIVLSFEWRGVVASWRGVGLVIGDRRFIPGCSAFECDPELVVHLSPSSNVIWYWWAGR